MTKIYLVEQGEYSNYHVVGIYDTKEKAQVVADYFNRDEDNYDKCEVVERVLNPCFEEINQGLSAFRVLMLKDGTVEKVFQIINWSAYGVKDTLVKYNIWRRSTAFAYIGENKPDCLDTRMFAKDEQHAIKIANERRIHLLARNQW